MSQVSVEVRVDYVQGTITFSSLDLLVTFLDSASSFLGVSWGWSSELTFKSPVSGMYGRISYEDLIFAQVFFPGHFCSQLQDQLFFVKFLIGSSFHVTRFDIALDDYSRRVSFDEVRRCGKNGLYALVETYKCVETGFKPIPETVPTCYFGIGDKMLRFYNAEVVHGILADRWELQLRNDWARVAVSDFLENPSRLASIVVSAVDFVEWDNVRRERSSRLDWWQSLIDDTEGEVRLSLPVYEPSLARMISWLNRQVAVSLAVLRAGLGRDAYHRYLDLLADRGESRFKDYHHAWVRDLSLGKEVDFVC